MARSNRSLARVITKEREVEIVERLGSIDLDNLREEYERTGADALFWGILTAGAKKRVSDADLAADIGEAKLGRRARMELEARGEKVTDQTAKDWVRASEEYRAAKQAVIDAQEQADMIESTKYVLAQKHENVGKLATMLAQEEAVRKLGTEGYLDHGRWTPRDATFERARPFRVPATRKD